MKKTIIYLTILVLGVSFLEADLNSFEESKLSCDKGDEFGCLQVGTEYELGGNVEVDMNKAMSLYRESCNKGCEEACDLI